MCAERANARPRGPRRALTRSTHDGVSQDPARDVVGRSDAQETFVRFEDLDLVAPVEASEFDRPHRVRLRADPHAAVADLARSTPFGGGLPNFLTDEATAAAVAAAVARFDALRTSLSGASSSTGVEVFVDDGRHRFDSDRCERRGGPSIDLRRP